MIDITGAYSMRSCRHYVTWSHVILLLVVASLAARRHDSHVVLATRSRRLVRQVVTASRTNERDARPTQHGDSNQVVWNSFHLSHVTLKQGQF